MLKLIVQKAKKSDVLNGLIYYKDGIPYGAVKVYFATPRKQGQRDYEFEEVKIELAE